MFVLIRERRLPCLVWNSGTVLTHVHRTNQWHDFFSLFICDLDFYARVRRSAWTERSVRIGNLNTASWDWQSDQVSGQSKRLFCYISSCCHSVRASWSFQSTGIFSSHSACPIHPEPLQSLSSPLLRSSYLFRPVPLRLHWPRLSCKRISIRSKRCWMSDRLKRIGIHEKLWHYRSVLLSLSTPSRTPFAVLCSTGLSHI